MDRFDTGFYRDAFRSEDLGRLSHSPAGIVCFGEDQRQGDSSSTDRTFQASVAVVKGA